MGRVAGKGARVQVTTRLTWTFSARAGAGKARGPRRRPGTHLAGDRLLSAALLRALLRVAHGRSRAPEPRALRSRRSRPR